MITYKQIYFKIFFWQLLLICLRYGGYSLGVMSSVPNLNVTDTILSYVKTMASQSRITNADDNLQVGYSNNNIKVSNIFINI